MTDETYYDGPFAKPAQWLLVRGFHPNHLTFLQLPILGLQVWCALAGWGLAFALLILVIVFLDAGDGILARVGRLQSRTGATLDSLFDTLGIAIVVWGTSRFFPHVATELMLLFVGNMVLFLQNALLESKAIGYLRGPLLIAVLVPETLWAALLLPAFTISVLIVWRLPATVKALGRHLPHLG